MRALAAAAGRSHWSAALPSGAQARLEDACMDAAAIRALPLSLQMLHVNQAEPEPQQQGHDSSLDLSHLAALSRLEFHDCPARAITLVLPPQPLSLVLWGNLAELSQPCELKSAHLAVPDRTSWHGLRQLAAQPRLAELHVECEDANAGWPSAAAAGEDAAAIASVLGQLQGVSYLDISIGSSVYHRFVVCLPLLQQLPMLPHLQRLDLRWDCGLNPADIVHLSKLTSLTSLFIGGLGNKIDDVTAVAVVGPLTHLQQLHLNFRWSDNVVTWSVLPVIGRLTDLRSLWVWLDVDCWDSLTRLVLQHLSPLTGLSYLSLPPSLPEEAVQQFLAAMPCLNSIQSDYDDADPSNIEYDVIAFPPEQRVAEVFS